MARYRTRIGKTRVRFKLIRFGILLAGSIVLGSAPSLKKPETEMDLHEDRRSTLAQENCTKSSFEEFPGDLFTLETRRRGAICLHFFFVCYLFILLVIVCDEYFVPCIQILSQRLNVSKDVAGATFMATATSSPELFINIIGTFVTEGDLGVGTIVGSAFFNILAVPAFCGLLGGRRLQMDWWPLTRDCLAYGITVVLLITFLSNDLVYWEESLILVIAYLLYIIVMYYNDPISRFVKKLTEKKKVYREVNLLCEKTSLLSYEGTSELRFKVQADELSLSETNGENQNSERCKGVGVLYKVPEGFWSKFLFYLFWPTYFILFLTMPDCKREKNQKFWPITFAVSIFWIGCVSYLVSWMITIFGTTFGIPDSVLGLTFLAAGMSLPEAASSIIITNQGHGDMGISSSISSNTFDILLCLGLPWLIKSTFLPTEPGKHVVKINSQGLGYTATSLLTTLAILYISFYANNFILDRKIGITCLVTYLIILVFSCLLELNVFFQVNLPMCGS